MVQRLSPEARDLTKVCTDCCCPEAAEAVFLAVFDFD